MPDYDIAKAVHTHVAADIADATDTGKSLLTATDQSAAKSAIGVDHVDNTADADKPISNATQAALNLKADAVNLTNVDNTHDIDKPISTATQTALNTKAPSFTPETFGALADGITDDQAAIIAAITAARNAGGQVVISRGKTYAIGSKIQISGSSGNNVTISGGGTIKCLAANTGQAILIQNCSNVIVENITIDMNKSVTTNGASTANQQGIYISGTSGTTSNIIVRGVTVINGWQRGIAVVSASNIITDITINRCTLSSVGDVAIFVSCAGNTDRITPSTSQRINIRNNIIADGGKGGIQVNGCSFVQVMNNNLDGTASTGHGICFSTTGTTGHVTDFICSGNTVKNYTASGKWGILASNNCKRFSINNNPSVYGNTGGISVDVEDSANLGVLVDVSGTVSGNSVKGSIGGTASHGINARICSNLTITGNTCTNNAGVGIAVSNAYACTINGNTTRSNTVYGIAIFGNNTGTGGHSISGNTMLDNVSANFSNSFPPIPVVTTASDRILYGSGWPQSRPADNGMPLQWDDTAISYGVSGGTAGPNASLLKPGDYWWTFTEVPQ